MLEDRIIEVDIKEGIGMRIVTEVGLGLEKGNTKGNIRKNNRCTSTHRDRIRCHKCREYAHFLKDCLTTKVKKEADQIQQMINLAKEQTSLKVLAADTYDSLN